MPHHGGHEAGVDYCLTCLLDARARQCGDATYFSCDGETITFAGLRNEAASLAARMSGIGLHTGAVVATVMPNSADHLVTAHACLHAGAVWAPLNVALGADDLAYAIQQIAPFLVLVGPGVTEHQRDVLAGSTSALVRTLNPEPASVLEALPHDECRLARHHWSPDELSWIIQSGASTGRSKAITIPHSAALNHARRVAQAINGHQDDVFFSALQMCHGWINFAILATGLMLGARCATTRWFSASRWLTQVRATGATVVDPFLPLASALVAQPPTAQDTDHKVRVAFGVYGGEAETAQRLAFESRFGIPTINCYGLTEAGALVARETPHDRRIGSAGRIHPDYEVAIAAGDGWTNQPGAEGEILVRPRRPGVVATGCLGAAEEMSSSWRDLWIHTGDLGRFDEEGYLYLHGRLSHWMRRKGENVSAAEVENSLRELDSVTDAAVFGIPSPLGDQELAAVIIAPAGATALKPQDVHAALRKRLAAFKVPRYLLVGHALPRTVKGDPDRPALAGEFAPDLYWDAEQEPT